MWSHLVVAVVAVVVEIIQELILFAECCASLLHFCVSCEGFWFKHLSTNTTYRAEAQSRAAVAPTATVNR